MNNIYEIQFLQCDITDITSLISLLESEGIEIEKPHNKENDMGIELLLLTVLIPPAVTVTTKLLDVLGIWLQNRNVEFVFKDKKKQKEITINYKSGKIPTEELNRIKSFME